jgi:hypothetical protein
MSATPTRAAVASIMENARELLVLIEDFNLIVEPEFLEVLTKLSENPVRPEAA